MQRRMVRLAALVMAVMLAVGGFPAAASGEPSYIANAGDIFFAVRANGTLMAWGLNRDCVLVDKPETDGVYIISPIQIMTGVHEVYVEDDTVFVEKTDGSHLPICDSRAVEDGCTLSGGVLRSPDGSELARDIVDIATNEGGINLALNNKGELLVWGVNYKLLMGDVSYASTVDEPLVMMDGIRLPEGVAAQPSPEPSVTAAPTPQPPAIPTIEPAPQPSVGPTLPRYLDTIDAQEGGEPSYWAAEEVALARTAGILPDALAWGYQQDITRLEFCVLMDSTIRAATGKSPAQIAEERRLAEVESFTDTEYAEPHDMARLGIVKGVGEGRFDPSSPITRQEAATMLRRAAELLGLDMTAEVYQSDEPIDDWAREGVDYVLTSGIMRGTGHGFEPLEPYTREQSVLTLLRLYTLAADAEK